MTLKERIARAIDPIAWEASDGMPTTKAKAAWEFDRAVSLTQAQAALEAMISEGAISDSLQEEFLNEANKFVCYDYAGPYFACDGVEPTVTRLIKAAIAER